MARDHKTPPEQAEEWPYCLTYDQLNKLCSDFEIQLLKKDDVSHWNTYLLRRKESERLNHWHMRWANNAIGWHRSEINPSLIKYFDQLTEGKTDQTFFFPLCGKTKDMLWVYQQGHCILGVDAVASAVQQFFEESKIEVVIEQCAEVDGWLYKSPDGRIKLWVCDLFKMTPSVLTSKIDCVFDRGSYVAINVEDRKPYIELMLSLCSSNSRHLLCAMEYDTSLYGGPPRHVDKHELFNFYNEIGKPSMYFFFFFFFEMPLLAF